MVAGTMDQYKLYKSSTASANKVSLSVDSGSISLNESDLHETATTSSSSKQTKWSYNLTYSLATKVLEQIRDDNGNLTKLPEREKVREKLLRAGALATVNLISQETPDLSPEDILRIGQLPDWARSSEDILDEIRGEY